MHARDARISFSRFLTMRPGASTNACFWPTRSSRSEVSECRC